MPNILLGVLGVGEVEEDLCWGSFQGGKGRVEPTLKNAGKLIRWSHWPWEFLQFEWNIHRPGRKRREREEEREQ